MKKFLFVFLLVILAVLLTSWSFSGQTTINRGPISKAGIAKASNINNDVPKNAELLKAKKAKEEAAKANEPAAASKAVVNSNDEMTKPKEENSSVNTTTVPEPPKWQPIYDEKGEVTNAQPAVRIMNNPSDYGQPPVILTTLLNESFNNWGPYGNNPPTGWTISDSGIPNAMLWDANNWNKSYYSSWADTVARVYYSPIQNQDEWIITPAVNFSGTPACSLKFNCYFYHYSASDTFYVLGSSDGVNYIDTIAMWVASHGGATKALSANTFNITSFAQGDANYRIAFRYKAYNGLYVYLDDIQVIKDATTLITQNFNGWGPNGDVPPAGWTILSKVEGFLGWDTNDWHKFYYSTWLDTIARIYNTPGETSKDWLVTPVINLVPSYNQVLLTFKQFYDDNTSTTTDTGWVMGSIDGGATWTHILATYTADQGSSSVPDHPSIDITSWANNHSNVKIGFKYVGHADYGWYLDSVKVEGIVLPAHDVATTLINSPTTFMVQGYSWPVSSRFTNQGTSTESFTTYFNVTHTLVTPFFTENFNSGLPGTWTVIDSLSDGQTWLTNAAHNTLYPTKLRDSTYFSGGYMIADVDAPGSGAWHYQSEQLITPWVSFAGRSNTVLQFSTYYYPYSSGQFGRVDIRTSAGAAWTKIDSFSTVAATGNLQYDIHGIADSHDSVQVRFWFHATAWAYWWGVDNVVFGSGAINSDYTDNKPVSSLASLASANVNFNNFTVPTPGTYNLKTYHSLATDTNRGNDTLVSTAVVYPHTGAGGPDVGYYAWKDNINGGGPAYAWRDISGIGTPIPFDQGTGGDRWSNGITMGFPFFFYGNNFSRIFIGENGLASFDTLTASNSYNYNLPYSYAPHDLLSLLWDDVQQGTGGTAYYYTNNADTFIVSYLNFQWQASTDSANHFDAQMIIDGAHKLIKFQYRNVGPAVPTLHTIGIQGSGATGYGLQYYYNGTPAGNLALSNLAVTFSYLPPSHDMATTAIVVPGTGIVNGATFTPRSVFTNLGALTETSVPVYFNIYDSLGVQIYTSTRSIATIAPTTVDSVNFNSTSISINSIYRCTTYVALPTDTYPGNDKLTSTFRVDQHYGTGGPDADYYLWKDNTVAGGPTYSWIEINPTLGGSGTSLTPTQDSVYDDRAYVFPIGFTFNYYGQSYTDAYASTNGLVLFDSTSKTSYSNVAIPTAAAPNAFVAAYWDDLYLRTNAGARLDYQQFGTYTVIEWTGDAQSSTDSMFLTFEVILYTNGEILVQYKQVGGRTDYSGEGATVGIESSNLAEDAVIGLQYLLNGAPTLNALTNSLAIKYYRLPPSHDIVAQNFLVPGASGTVGVPFIPQVVFLNNATNPEPSVPVRLLITPGTYNNAQTASMLASGKDTVSFASFTPTTGGVYNLTAIATLGGDAYPANDTVRMTFTAYDQVINFEAGNGSLTGTGDWQWGTPTSGPGAAYSGVNCWATKLDTNYTTGLSYLDFKIQVGASGSAAFGFTQWYYYESSYDGGNFKISTDNGTTWVLLHPAAGYTGFTNSSNPLYGTAGDSIFTSSTHQFWHVASFDLTPYLGQIIMARLSSGADGSVFYPGWYVDDFAFANCSLYLPAHDVGVDALTSPTGSLNGGQTYSITASIKNFGSNTETFNVRAFDNHGYSNVQTITALAPSASAVATFPSWTVAACSTYALKIATQLGTDVNAANDTAKANYVVTPPYNHSMQFDDGTIADAGYFYESTNIIATKFVADIGGALTSVGYRFLGVGDPYWPWPARYNNQVQVYLFTDTDLDGQPDATPILMDTLTAAAGGWTSWPIGCTNSISLTCGQQFWAGWSVVDTSIGAIGGCLDAVNDHPANNWLRLAGVWDLDTSSTNFNKDHMIRAYINGDLSSVNISVGSTSVYDTVASHGQDTVTKSLDNTGTSCDLVYTVAVHQITPGLLNNVNQSPIGHNVYTNAKGKFDEPIYPSVTLGSGGPDAFGYRWKDSDESGGPTYGWVDISATGTTITFDSCSSSYGCYDEGYTYAGIPMGMPFSFYGTSYDTIYVSSNGWMSFIQQISAYMSNASIPTAAVPNGIIAPMWDDLEGDSLAGGSVMYYHDTAHSRFIISWLKWAPYSVMADTFNMQVILNGDGSIVMQYGPGTYSNDLDYTVGIENADGTIGLQTAYSPTTAYLHANMAILYNKPFSWLSTDLVGGTLSPAAPPVPFNIFFNGSGLDDGTYTGAIVINSNDPDQPVTTINITFKVGLGAACQYLLGDVNSDDLVRGGDVTYAVRYFKGLGSVPPDSCYDIGVTTPTHWLYVSGDVNGDCKFMGSDVTRLVSYFKGVSVLVNCHFFPHPILLNSPTELPPSSGKTPTSTIIPNNSEKQNTSESGSSN